TLNGIVDGGAGTDALVIDITGGGLLNQVPFDRFVNFEEQSITGTGTITTDGPLSIDSLVLRDAHLTLAAGQTLKTASDTSIVFASGANSLVNLGTITGSLSFAEGTNSFVNLGSIAGPVTLSGGTNSFTVGAGSSVSGPVIANGTDDLLILATGGTDAAPQELWLSGFTGFERTRQDSGTLALSDDFTTGQLTLAGGRFIGRTGSVLNASSILVKQDATFGSAGTVNGDITVQGILSPGSSPGTMTINGNVALAGNSTTLFEMTPTISDALIINGSLNIAPGATLRITGNRPLTPGVTYELITTTGGITGSFTTIDKASSVVGFVRQGDHSIDLLGQFVLGSGASGQVTQTVNYLNDLLIAGTATSGILNAAPSLLLADGTVNQAAAARLNAESYASASQIGIENGLAIASTLRTASTSARGEEAGLFTFGQTLGGWRRLPGDAALGTARANISTYGALAGIGIGSQTASLGAFVGYIDARQQIGALQARTKADGIMAGAVAQASLGSFHVAASLSHDGSKADTDRSLLSSSKLSSHYRLRSWTADISLSHAFALDDGWSFEPEVGFTHVSSRRGSASETGDAVWALDVQGRRTKASFLRGALELHGPAEARINPWLSAGVLHQLSGNSSFATAAYASVSDDLTVAGVSRSSTLATVGAGVNLRVSSAANLFFSGNSEFGAESSGQNLTAGLRIRF
ncbi:autotransporter outer membrane beta-barrel domain-containing protein, partial [Sphingobium sp. Sx8-8]|uniref:autotransporter family protein n=1 Tax=Sphingobium sp. Sx8-8 TaxID=2933617 RepID=UPI001F57A0A9